MRSIIVSRIEVKITHTLEVTLYLRYTKRTFCETHVRDSTVEFGQQRISTAVNATMVYPDKGLSAEIIILCTEISSRGITIST